MKLTGGLVEREAAGETFLIWNDLCWSGLQLISIALG
jgi:hypothetical protein